MGIDYSQLKSLTARKIISALINDGFELITQKGSHQKYRHSDKKKITVSFHSPSDTFNTKTLKSMIEIQACWTEDDLKRLNLIK